MRIATRSLPLPVLTSYRQLFDCRDQSLDLFIARVTSAADSHQTFGLQSEAIDNCLGIEVPVRNKQALLGQSSRNFSRCDILDDERNSRRAGDVRRRTEKPHAVDI